MLAAADASELSAAEIIRRALEFYFRPATGRDAAKARSDLTAGVAMAFAEAAKARHTTHGKDPIFHLLRGSAETWFRVGDEIDGGAYGDPGPEGQ